MGFHPSRCRVAELDAGESVPKKRAIQPKWSLAWSAGDRNHR